jgi:hypothetical protein
LALVELQVLVEQPHRIQQIMLEAEATQYFLVAQLLHKPQLVVVMGGWVSRVVLLLVAVALVVVVVEHTQTITNKVQQALAQLDRVMLVPQAYRFQNAEVAEVAREPQVQIKLVALA